MRIQATSLSLDGQASSNKKGKRGHLSEVEGEHSPCVSSKKKENKSIDNGEKSASETLSYPGQQAGVVDKVNLIHINSKRVSCATLYF
jgi:hypothetical protein